MTTNSSKNLLRGLTILVFLVCACSENGDGDTSDPPADDSPSGDVVGGGEEPSGGAAGGEENTFDHPEEVDPFDLLDRIQDEGPARYSSRIHSCPKMKYATIGRVLRGRGVDLAATAPDRAGAMWAASDQALGAPNYGARARENLDLTTSSASKLMDIFVQAAPEIIANMPNKPACQVGGVGATMFDESGKCTADGITCLSGVPATADHIELCNQIVTRASSEQVGRLIAVATVAASAHTCE